MALSVCQFGTYPPPVTGISVHIESLAERLRQVGVTVRIIDTTANPRGGFILRWARSLLHYAVALLRGMAASEHVVHVHGCAGLTFWSRLPLLLTLRLRRKSTVYTNHSGNFGEWAGRQRLTRPLLRFSVSLASRVIALNEDQRQAYLSLGYPEERLPVIIPFVGACGGVSRLPTEVEAFASRHSPLICASGGWRQLYGLESFVVAFAELRQSEEFAGAGAVALMSFSAHDEQSYREEIQNEVAARGLADHIMFLPSGQTPHEEAIALIRASDVFVRPSLHDGDSVSVREALSLGTATVASDTGLRPEGCLVYEPGNASALKRLLREACAGQSSGTFVVQPSAGDESFDRTLALYRELAG